MDAIKEAVEAEGQNQDNVVWADDQVMTTSTNKRHQNIIDCLNVKDGEYRTQISLKLPKNRAYQDQE